MILTPLTFYLGSALISFIGTLVFDPWDLRDVGSRVLFSFFVSLIPGVNTVLSIWILFALIVGFWFAVSKG